MFSTQRFVRGIELSVKVINIFFSASVTLRSIARAPTCMCVLEMHYMQKRNT